MAGSRSGGDAPGNLGLGGIRGLVCPIRVFGVRAIGASGKPCVPSSIVNSNPSYIPGVLLYNKVNVWHNPSCGIFGKSFPF